MDYVVRILDINGKLKKERIMFYAVRILDNDGKLKNIVKSKLLSQRHWQQFPEYLKTKGKRKNIFNTYFENNNGRTSVDTESYLKPSIENL